MHVDRIQIDSDFEDDGLFSVTFWLTPPCIPSYISIARDELEEPDVIYFEAEDQIHGFKTTNLSYNISENVLSFEFPAEANNSFCWSGLKRCELEVNGSDVLALQTSLQRIFQLGRKFEM